MNIFSRILLAVYAFCLAIISAVVMLITIRPVIFDAIDSFIKYNVLGNTATSIAMFIIALVFFVLSFVFLLSGMRSNKEKRAVSKHTNIGEIRISLNSIENIALSAAKKLSGVKEAKAEVMKLENSVSIVIKMMVMPDINIPALSEEMQQRVKKSVEESAGISVHEVKVVVESIYSGMTYKPRVE